MIHPGLHPNCKISSINMPRTPSSSYRLQLHAGFTFDDAPRVVGYLKDLGISHVYCSPYLEAAKGSLHGYDVVNHQKWLRMERGTISAICNLGELQAKPEKVCPIQLF